MGLRWSTSDLAAASVLILTVSSWLPCKWSLSTFNLPSLHIRLQLYPLLVPWEPCLSPCVFITATTERSRHRKCWPNPQGRRHYEAWARRNSRVSRTSCSATQSGFERRAKSTLLCRLKLATLEKMNAEYLKCDKKGHFPMDNLEVFGN